MKFEQYNFFCPKCDSQLDQTKRVHLKSERGNGAVGDMYLSTTFGSYVFEHEPSVEFSKDELVDFSCPHCREKLSSAEHPEYITIIMRVENKFDFELLFSRRAGVHKTYIVTEDGIENYGESASQGF